MDSKQFFTIVAIVAALSTLMMIASPVMAQNITGGNMTGGNMTGKISSIDPPADFFGRSGCPVDAEGIERCPPPTQDQTDSNEGTSGNENDDASGDGNEGDNSNDNENEDNQ
jgi:hypothetical protein